MARKGLWRVVVLGLLVFGLFLAGCPVDGGNNPVDGGNNPEDGKDTGKDTAKKLTITGIEGISGDVAVMFTTEVNNQSAAILVRNDDGKSGTGVAGKGTISNGSITIPLKVIRFSGSGLAPSITEENWTGTGNYYIWLWNKNTFSGAPPYSAPVSASWTEKVGFTSETTTIPWSKFGTSPD